MKKIIWIFIAIAIIIISFLYGYFTYRNNNDIILQENAKYENYLNKEIYGSDVTTIINKVIDDNNLNNIEKDNKGKYIENSTNSIKMDIKFIDIDTIIPAETIYKGGIENFIKNYNTIKFKLMKIEYHKKTKKIKYLYLEQITN